MRYSIDRFLGTNSANFSVKRKGKRSRLTALLVAVLFSAMPLGASAAEYNIGGPSSTHTTLQALKNDTNITLRGGDIINFYNATDNSLTLPLLTISDFSGGQLTFTTQTGGTVISPSPIYTDPTNIRFLDITDTTNTAVVSAENITFTGFGYPQGSVISTTGSLTFGNSTTFLNNNTGGFWGSGGAIYVDQIGIIGNTNFFTGNTAISYGGAIYAGNGLTIGEGNSFTNNTAGVHGGAIWANSGNVTIGSGTTFTANTATAEHGGAIVAWGGNVIINDSTATNTTSFAGNSAGAGGGAIYASGSVNIGEYTIFGGANATDGNTSGSHGGAIYAAGGSATVGDYSQFLNNSTGAGWANGGAIYANTTATIGNYTTFTGNSSGAHGGAVYALGNVDIGGNNTFTGNVAPSQGGAVYSYSGTVTTGNNNTFGGAVAGDGNTALFGGAIFATNDITVGTTNTFQGNSAVFGGAVYSDTGKVTVGDGSNFIANAGGWAHGGAIYASTGVTIGKNNSFTGNTTGGNGGAVYTLNGNVEVGSGTNFLDNRTPGGNGGAISAHAGTVTILSEDGSTQTFSGNAAGVGGAIYASGNVIIEGNTTFGSTNVTAGNTAVAHGGAIYSDLGSVTTGVGIDFLNSKITGWGGGGAIYSATGVTIAAGNKFDGNTAVSHGGAVWANAGDVTIGSGTQFLNNVAGWGHGGAVYSNSGMVFGGDALRFIGNTSGDKGGAIFAETGVTIGDGSTFNYNTSSGWGGGAIFAETGNISVGSGATFLGNNATQHAGGAINGYGNSPEKDGIVTVGANSTFGGYGLGEGNRAVGSGGAIYATTEANIGANASFIGNSSSAGQGGAIYVYGWDDRTGTSLMFTGDVSLANNTAMKGQLQTNTWRYDYDWTYGSGGAVYVEFGDIVFDGATTFDNNHAAMHGGAIANRFGDVSFGDNVRLTGNSVGFVGANKDPLTDSYGGDGGAIYANGNVIIGNNLVLSDNKTLFAPWQTLPKPNPDNYEQFWLLEMGNGGGIFSRNGAIRIGNEALLENNVAARRGGAIHAAVDDQGQWWNRDELSVFIGDNLQARNNSSETSYGGAIYSQFNVTIGDHAKFENNEALHVPKIPDNPSDANQPEERGIFDYGDAGRGGAIFSHRGNIVIGVLGVDGFGTDAAGGLHLYGNRSAGHGGAIVAWDQDTFDYHTENLKKHEEDPENNPIDYDYAYHFLDRGNIVIGANAQIENNHSLYASGGALHAQFGNVVVYENATITGNTAGMEEAGRPDEWKIYGDGGSICGLDVYIGGNNTTFTNNEANQRGGAIFADMSVYVGGGTQFLNNTAHFSGGAIFSQSTGAWVTINGTEGNEILFQNNTATASLQQGDGGAINVHRGSLLVAHTTFNDNHATGITEGFGGAVNVGDGSRDNPSTGTGYIGDYTIFTNNSAASHGGAISARGGENADSLLLDVYGDGVRFVGNTAGKQGITGHGGAIFSDGMGLVNIGVKDETRDIVFNDNHSTQSGGAVSVNTNLFVGDGVVFQDNHAGIWSDNPLERVRGRGGAIHMDGETHFDGDFHTLTMEVHSTDSLFTNNTAVMEYSYVDLNGNEQRELRKVYNDIALDGNSAADMYVAAGRSLQFDGGVTIEHNIHRAATDSLSVSNAANWTMFGGGTVILGGYFIGADGNKTNSRSYAAGTTTLGNDTTLYLEYGAQIGIDRVGTSVAGQGGKHVGTFVSSLNSTIAMEVDNSIPSQVRYNQYNKNDEPLHQITEITVADGHSWIHGETIRINDTTTFELDGVVWQPKTVYNLAETTLLYAHDTAITDAEGITHYYHKGDAIRLRDYNGLLPDQAYAAVKANAEKNIFVETGLNRGLVEGETNDSFATGAQAIKYANNVGDDVTGLYVWRDFVYYSGIGTPGAAVNDARILTDANNNVVREYGSYQDDPNVKGNIYAVELIRADVGAPMYYDPSFINRSLTKRIMRPLCCCVLDCPAQCEDGCNVCDELTPHPVSVLGRVDYHNDWNFWGEGFGMGGNIRHSTVPSNTRYSNAGLIVGGDREELGEWILGGYYSYGSSLSRTNETYFGSVHSNVRYKGGEHRFGGYLRLDDRFGYTFANGYLGTNNYDYNRQMQAAMGIDRFYGKFNARTSGLYLERGADILANNRNTVTPFGALQYANLFSGNFAEQSDNAADMAQTMRFNYDSLRTVLGIQGQTRLTTRLKWDNRFAWEHELQGDTGIVKNAYLTQYSDTNFRIVGDYGGRDWYNFRTGLNWDLSMRLCVNFDYDLYFNKNGAFHAGMGGLTYRH